MLQVYKSLWFEFLLLLVEYIASRGNQARAYTQEKEVETNKYSEQMLRQYKEEVSVRKRTIGFDRCDVYPPHRP